jgi:hypothetical protein
MASACAVPALRSAKEGMRRFCLPLSGFTAGKKLVKRVLMEFLKRGRLFVYSMGAFVRLHTLQEGCLPSQYWFSLDNQRHGQSFRVALERAKRFPNQYPRENSISLYINTKEENTEDATCTHATDFG